MRRLFAFSLAVCSLCPAVAKGQPSLWQRVHEPRAPRAEAFLRTFGKWLDAVPEASGDPGTMQDFRLAVIATAELAGAHASEDPRVLLVLGHALLDADIGREAEAQAIAERVLEKVGPRDAWLEAEARMLDALSSRGSPALAIRKVTQALPHTWSPGGRSTLFRVRAEAKMTAGDLRGALRDQQAAFEVATRPIHKALARFGLGLVLERSGNLPAALVELRFADAGAPRSSTTNLGVIDGPGVFRFREFDVHYVSALTAMALAAKGPEALGRIEYERALVEWERFETAAPSDDPWLGNARLHRQMCERELEAEPSVKNE